MIVIFLVLFAVNLATAVLTPGNKAGGQVCDFSVQYNMVWDGVEVVNVPSFAASLSLNATGFYSTEAEYRPWNDECPDVTAYEEQGVSAFSLTYDSVEFSRDNGKILYNGPWFTHYPVGLPASQMVMNDILDYYFEYLMFRGQDGDNELAPCCDDGYCFCICPYDGTMHCAAKIVRTDCYDNTIEFTGNVQMQLGPNGDLSESSTDSHLDYEWYYLTQLDNLTSELASPVIVAENSGVVYVDSLGNYVDLSEDLCPTGTPCWYFRQTPNWHGPELDLAVEMWLAVGQAQRVQLEINYRTLPNNAGPICVYFDYTGANLDPASIVDQTSFNRVWCGNLQPYNAQLQSLHIELPLTYGPSNDAIDVGDNGYDEFQPFFIVGNPTSSFVVYSVEVNVMGQSYANTCGSKRRQGWRNPDSDTPTQSYPKANYSQYMISPPEGAQIPERKWSGQ